MPVVSNAGGFSVVLPAFAMVKRIELKQRDGSTAVQHWIEFLDGQVHYTAVCLRPQQASDLVASFRRMPGATPQTSPQPGDWFTTSSGGTDGRVRVVTIDGRGCMASVEGPSGRLPSERVESFLLSLHAAP